MIVKHVPMASLARSSFSGLAKYITDSQSKEHRLGQVVLTNCAATELADAILEIEATQRINTRAKSDKTYHLIVSFRSGEIVGNEVLRSIEQRICDGLGLGHHQRISAVHNDTDNQHVHIAINKIDPVRNTMQEPYFSHRKLSDLCVALENDFGLQSDNHMPRQTRGAGRAQDMERHAGVDSLVGWVRRECLSGLVQAASWSELHGVLAENGLAIKVRANGFVLMDKTGVTVKASSIDRALSKPKLEARLGGYEPPTDRDNHQPRREYEKRPTPTPIDTTALWSQYKAAQQQSADRRASSSNAIRQAKAREIAAVKRANKARRSAIKLLSRGRATKKLLYAQAYNSMRRSIDAINARYTRQRAAIADQSSRQTWADWLRAEATRGNETALQALRARSRTANRSIEGQALRSVTSSDASDALSRTIASGIDITKRGTVVMPGASVRVKDSEVLVGAKASLQDLADAMVVARQQFGQTIVVNGDAAFRAKAIQAAVVHGLDVRFSDESLEQRRVARMGENDGRNKSGRRAGRSIGSTGPGAASYLDDSTTSTVRPAQFRAGQANGIRLNNEGTASINTRQPNTRGVARRPPPERANRLRKLSELGVVRFASGNEGLLQGHVPDHVVKRSTEPDHPLRRPVPGIEDPVSIYIAERESKRRAGIKIAPHKRYNGETDGLTFAGVRRVASGTLALFGFQETVLVKQIDGAEHAKLSRLRLGTPISVTQNGNVRATKKGPYR